MEKNEGRREEGREGEETWYRGNEEEGRVRRVGRGVGRKEGEMECGRREGKRGKR